MLFFFWKTFSEKTRHIKHIFNFQKTTLHIKARLPNRVFRNGVHDYCVLIFSYFSCFSCFFCKNFFRKNKTHKAYFQFSEGHITRKGTFTKSCVQKWRTRLLRAVFCVFFVFFSNFFFRKNKTHKAYFQFSEGHITHKGTFTKSCVQKWRTRLLRAVLFLTHVIGFYFIGVHDWV